MQEWDIGAACENMWEHMRTCIYYAEIYAEEYVIGAASKVSVKSTLKTDAVQAYDLFALLCNDSQGHWYC